ncbi:dTDP-4-dehydrorhamnose 3,5-epimerase [Gammaproteobacteria bacterium]|nr:dTDP-4-dehydrorhamnose 3,5-epimerase [Gammaproteobacteria bacterium]
MDTELIDSFEGVKLTQLKRIPHQKGDIFHALKSSEESFLSFGEAYFSAINPKEIKGWKKHTQMVMNLIVPVGAVMFHFYDDVLLRGAQYQLGEENYYRLTIQPGYWMAFEGVGAGLNLVLNIASIQHDSSESISAPLNTFPLAGEHEV